MVVLLLVGCSSSGVVRVSQDYIDAEAGFHEMLIEEEKNCAEHKGEWTEYGCYYEDNK